MNSGNNSQNNNSNIMQSLRPFLIGMVSCCTATTFIQPIDTVKVRIQAINELNSKSPIKQSTNPFSVLQQIKSQNGAVSLYKGLDAALLRQVLYASVRIGLFQTISDSIKQQKGRNLTFQEKTVASLFTGLVGAVMGNPAGVCLTRIQVDDFLHPRERRNYRNVGNALARITKEEGLFKLWRGCPATIMRAMCMNFGQLAFYDSFKEIAIQNFQGTEESPEVKMIAAIGAGVISATLALPADNIKMKLMKMSPNMNGQLPYRGLFDCLVKSVRFEGVAALWVGLPTFILRVTPQAAITLQMNDKLNCLWKRKYQY